ncbi:MAG: cytochrome c maturation protein CcmE [Polyangiaceae bacterium]
MPHPPSDPDAPDATTEAAQGPEGEGHTVPKRRTATASEPKKGARVGVLVVIGLVTVGAALVGLVLGGMQDKGMYSKDIDALVREKSRFQGKVVRAEGTLVHGTLVKRESPCEYRFSIERNGTVVPVRFGQCIVPDTFRDLPDTEVGVTVEGKLLADNSFEATLVLAKCPSKYDMDQRAKKGESMPHAAPGRSM